MVSIFSAVDDFGGGHLCNLVFLAGIFTRSYLSVHSHPSIVGILRRTLYLLHWNCFAVKSILSCSDYRGRRARRARTFGESQKF